MEKSDYKIPIFIAIIINILVFIFLGINFVNSNVLASTNINGKFISINHIQMFHASFLAIIFSGLAIILSLYSFEIKKENKLGFVGLIISIAVYIYSWSIFIEKYYILTDILFS